jgi:two-component system cell cycle response regulator
MSQVMPPRIQLLLIDGNPEHMQSLVALFQSSDNPFDMVNAERLEDALALLPHNEFAAVLIAIADNHSPKILRLIHTFSPEMPIIILGKSAALDIAIEWLQHGAQDYLAEGLYEGELLRRAIYHAIERQRWLEELRAASLKDELTGLYNRRGFNLMAEQHFKLARRLKKRLAFFFFDLDGLKKINDTYGHVAGDIALTQTAQALSATFRKSDLIARIGGDELVVLAIEDGSIDAVLMQTRLQRRLTRYNSRINRGKQLHLSMGVVHASPSRAWSLKVLLHRADHAMYRHKRSKPR